MSADECSALANVSPPRCYRSFLGKELTKTSRGGLGLLARLVAAACPGCLLLAAVRYYSY